MLKVEQGSGAGLLTGSSVVYQRGRNATPCSFCMYDGMILPESYINEVERGGGEGWGRGEGGGRRGGEAERAWVWAGGGVGCERGGGTDRQRRSGGEGERQIRRGGGGEGGGGRREDGGERENERTNERFFINEGKGISTILFFIQPSGKTKSTKTIENKIIIKRQRKRGKK